MEADNLDRLIESVNRDVERQLAENPDLFAKTVDIDAVIAPEDVTVDLARELLKMAPFGEGNPEPVFRMHDVNIRNVTYMGAEYTHARFSASEGKTYAPCVLFRRAQDLKPLLEGGGRADITGTVSHQVWRGQERVQFIVEDIDAVN